MAWIDYRPKEDVPERDRIGDDDNILRIHYVHPPVARNHMALYLQLMRRPGSLTNARSDPQCMLNRQYVLTMPSPVWRSN